MSPIVFDHIAIAVPRMADAPAVLVGLLGGEPRYGMEAGVFRWGQWGFAGGGRIEVLEPVGRDGFLHRFLAERGPGIHHVTFRVPSLRTVCGRAEGHGYKIVGYDDSNPAWKEAFLHPRQALGIVVQFAEAGPGSEDALRSWTAPPGPPNPPPSVTLLGLRLSARSAERARNQWGSLCTGEVQESSRQLTFRWPAAPLRIVVEIDPARDEGPIAIDYASDTPLALPAGPHPVLGTIFRRISPAS